MSRTNKNLRTTAKACRVGEIEGYPDPEIINIEKFVINIEEVTVELIVDVDGVVEDLRRFPRRRKKTTEISRKSFTLNLSRPLPQGGLQPSEAIT